MAEVGDWLRSIAPAYAQYCASFAENGIDGFTLLRSGSEELKDLGVTRPAHRARLLGDIARQLSSPLSANAMSLGAAASSSVQPITPKGHSSRRTFLS